MCTHRRQPNGEILEIELTDAELFDAASEYEANNDLRTVQEEVKSHLLMAPDNTPDSAAISFFGKVTTVGTLKSLLNDTDKLSKVASKMRDFLDNDAGCVLTDFEDDCRTAAFNELIDELLP